jgi:hypothetical protein
MNPRNRFPACSSEQRLSTARLFTVLGAGCALVGYATHDPNAVYCNNLTQHVEKINCSIPSNISCASDRDEYVDTVNITCGNSSIDWANKKSAKSEHGFSIFEGTTLTLSILCMFYTEKVRISRNLQRFMPNRQALVARPDEENPLLPDAQHDNNVLTPLPPH